MVGIGMSSKIALRSRWVITPSIGNALLGGQFKVMNGPG